MSRPSSVLRTAMIAVFLVALGSTLVGSPLAGGEWGYSNVDADSITMLAGSLNLGSQANWLYYNGGDAPEGSYQGTLRVGTPSIQGSVKLPKPLSPGRYFVFFLGVDYSQGKTIQASLGGGATAAILLNDRDANYHWSDPGTLDVTTASDTLVVTLFRNPNLGSDQKFLLEGVYITTKDKTVMTSGSVAVNLTYPTVMDNSAPIKGNLLANAGFELGVDSSWGFVSYRDVPLQTDSTQAFEGQSSLKIPIDHGANIVGDKMVLASRAYHLKPNKKYTISAWVKTLPGQTVPMTLNLTNPYVPPAGYPAQATFGNLLYATGSWQRVSATGYALAYPNSDYEITIISNELAGGYLWIDAIQLEEGDLTAYQPSVVMDARIAISNQPGNVFYEDEAVSGTLLAVNGTSAAATGVFRYQIFDFMNWPLTQGSQTLSLAAQTRQQTPISLSTGKRGVFRIVSWIDGREGTQRELSYSIIPRPAVAGADPTSYLGISPNYATNQLSLLQKMGIKWSRANSPSGYFRWADIEPIEGQITWYDAELQRAVDHGIATMGCIGTNARWPAWANNGGLPDLAKWETFVGQLAAHYSATLVPCWEIWNESYTVFSADFYAQMLKHATDAIERNNPNAKVVGMGGVPLSYMQAVISALQTRYPTWDWKQHLHILATHEYPNGEPPERFKTPIIDAYKVDVWNTETGAWDLGHYQGDESSFMPLGKPLLPYLDGYRYYSGMMDAPVLVAENFLRSIANGQNKYFYYDSRSGASPANLNISTTLLESDGSVRAKGIAYAIAGSLVDRATGLGNAASGQNSYFLTFDRAAGPIAALFSGDYKPRQVTLSLSPSLFRVLDMMGNPIPSGSTVAYGRFPVYVQGIGITASALKTALQNGIIADRADTTPPNVSISSAPRGPVQGGSFRVRWIAMDDISYPSLEQDAPDAILYSYRLAGFSAWSSWAANTFVDYAQIPNGSYTFEVMARDRAGNLSSVASRLISIGSVTPPSLEATPPTVSITSPANGATVSGTISVTTSTSDNVGVGRVDLWVDGSLLMSSTTAPLSFSWNSASVANGSHTLIARAYDTAGNGGTSGTVTVTVSNGPPDTTAPTVAISSPAGGAIVSRTISVTTTAWDNVGVTRVDLYVDGCFLKSSTTAPFSFTWNTGYAADGAHTLMEKAFDAAGNIGTSSAVSVTTSNGPGDITPPTVSITSPANGATVSGTIAITTALSDNVGIAHVDLYLDGAYLMKSTAPPFSLSWNTGSVANGSHSILARAYDPAGYASNSPTITVTVRNAAASTPPPTVSISSPANGATLSGTVPISTAASDNVGVTRVDLYVDGVFLISSTTAPFGFSWNSTSVANGSHTLSEKAFDAANNVGTSSTLSVTVSNGPTNVALASHGGVASASSSAVGFEPSGSNNGDRKGLNWGNHGGWNDATAVSFPDWLQISFSAVKSIGEIDVFTLQDNYTNPVEPTPTMTFSLYGITDFQVQTWDGSAWVTVPGGSVSGNNLVWRKFTFRAISTNAIRVLVTNAPHSYARIVEVEAYVTNVALAANGGVASASSSYVGFEPAGAIDGDRKGLNWGNHGGWNDATSASFPDWLQITFNGVKSISEIDVVTLQDSYANPVEPTPTMTFTYYGITDFQVQTWNGSAWVTIPGGGVSGNNLVWRKFSFPAISTSAIRILVTNALRSYSRIVEVEAYEMKN